MAVVLRFVQRYLPKDRDAFLSLEAQFASMERSRPELPQGRRRQPLSGNRSSNTLIWECEFETLREAESALARLSADPQHEALYRQQAPFIADAVTEFDEVLDL